MKEKTYLIIDFLIHLIYIIFLSTLSGLGSYYLYQNIICSIMLSSTITISLYPLCMDRITYSRINKIKEKKK